MPSYDLHNSKNWIEYLDEHFDECKDYFKFALTWMSFNSFYEIKYKGIGGGRGKGAERAKIEKFCDENKEVYDNLISCDGEFAKIVTEFKNTKNLYGPENRICVANETRDQEWLFGEDKKSCLDFMNVIYQIRNNFFHGSKDVSNPRNNDLIKWAYKYLNIFWRKFLEKNS
jgi:hypothetical protein